MSSIIDSVPVVADVAVADVAEKVAVQMAKTPSPMLLHGYDAAIFRRKQAVYVSEKYDGWRVYYRAGTFYTRAGNILAVSADLAAAVDAASAAHGGLDFDGELWMGYGRTSSDVNGVDASARLMFFDAPNAAHSFAERAAILARIDFAHERIGVVGQTVCANEAEMTAVYDAVLARGGEGVVLRLADQVYEHGVRARYFMKKKPVESCEAIVRAHHTTAGAGAKDVAGYVSSLIVESLDARKAIFKVSVKTTAPPAIGSIVTVNYCQMTSTGLPKFPVLVGVRAAVDMPADVAVAVEAAVVVEPAVPVAVVEPVAPASAAPKPAKVPRVKKNPAAVKRISGYSEYEVDVMKSYWLCQGVLNADEITAPIDIKPGHHYFLNNGKGSHYKVTRARAGDVYYCSCDAWKWQALPACFRTCKHCIAVANFRPEVPAAVRDAAQKRKEERKALRAAKKAAALAAAPVNMP
jgi:DNA ligase-1